MMETKTFENLNGGSGIRQVKYILTEQEMNNKGKMFAEVTLQKGCALGFHMHSHESETYYILKGRGEYNDNGTKYEVGAGDRTFTPDGCGHGLANIGDEDLVFMALIIFD